MGRPLLAASAAFVAGAFVGLELDAGLCWLLSALICALCLLACQRLERPTLLLVPLSLAVGLARAALHERPVDLPPPQGPQIFEGTVLSTEPRQAGLELLLRLERWQLDEELARLEPGPLVRLTLRGLAHRGDRLRLFGKLHRPPRALNPGGRDRRRDLGLRGISLEGSAELVEVLSRGAFPARLVDELRERFAARARELATSPERGAVLAALAVGDRSSISAELDDELSASGLIHLLASAGLHLAVLALLARLLASRLWLRSPWAPKARAAAVGALFALPLVLAEVALLGANWPSVRAGAGAALVLLGLVWARRTDSPTVLALGAAGCAVIDPASTHDLALQLSVAGVAGILLLSAPLRDLLPVQRPLHARRFRRALEKPLQLVCTTAAAMLCTAPILAAAFHRLSLVAVPANALGLAPGLAAIPLATLAGPIDLLSTTLALPLYWAADLLAGLTLLAARLFSAIPFAALPVAAPGAVTCALWYAGVLLLAGAPHLSEDARARPRTRLLRAALPFGLLALLFAARLLRARLSPELRVTFLAVGQGDAALVQLPFGHTLLVDAGGDVRGLPAPLGQGKRDPGARDILPALAELSIYSLDAVVLTHPHPDHAGGMLSVLDHVPVGQLWSSGEPGPGGIGDLIRARAKSRGVELRLPAPLLLGSVQIEVPSGPFSPLRSANDNSIVLRLLHGKVALLFAGDVEALAEVELAHGKAPLQAALLKAGHHGSRTSSTDAFLRRVKPQQVVYCVGEHNQFGFPHPEVVARTQALGATTWRTDEGAVVATSDGTNLTVRRWDALE